MTLLSNRACAGCGEAVYAAYDAVGPMERIS